MTADKPLDGKNSVLGVDGGLALGRLADETLAVLGEGDHRRRQTPPLGRGDNGRLAAFHHRYD